MNSDVEKYINHINNKNGKRTNPSTFSRAILADLSESCMTILSTLSKEMPEITGSMLVKFVESIKNDFEDSIKQMRILQKSLKKTTDEYVANLSTIATISNCVDILNEMIDYSKKNRSKDLKQCLESVCNMRMAKLGIVRVNVPEKKNLQKAKKQKIVVAEEVYEDDSEDETSGDEDDYGDNDDDDDEDDEGDETDEKKNEFLKQMYKSNNDDMDDQIINYYKKLSKKERTNAMSNIKEIKGFHSTDKPIVFQIMDMPLPINMRNLILKNYMTLISSRCSENKLRNWFDSLMTIPFGKYKGIDLKSLKSSDVKDFINKLDKIMNDAVYGHDDAKRQIIQMMGQQIRNPGCKGSMLGIWGVPGNGKTSLVKEGIAKAMDKPFVYISLGGATDASFLEGHSYTYEGSIYGRIVNGLISSKCMDPIIYFDELDKISKCHKGEEITNILIHLTDPVQNSHFRDRYFHGIDIDLSRATMIFSFNDPENINPILLDRITTVETKFLLSSQKLHIASNYLMKEIMNEMGLKKGDITFDDETISKLIENYTNEGGVRKLKSLLYNIVRELNLANLTKSTIDNDKVIFPFKVMMRHIKVLLKNKNEVEHDKVHKNDMSGIINGLWANSMGGGGVLPIQVLWVPSQKPLEVKATGNLQQVIKESTEVATTLAWNKLPEDIRNNYLTEWEDSPMGFHIHCPDGATPKDGPSAGTAITLTLYSLLTNRKIRHDVAITGEINFQGHVTAIGGLENKLEGAKRAGVKLAMYPKENEKDIKKIKERNPTLFDSSFKVVAVETLEEAIKHAFV